eukprot:CAMPEP_0197884478 /NCGR_PEP_ID=MMETSP1439-20131203/10914_1 /TAXON_ID=66791 /ORGANISM="Gonyaulax spinifera, Strain CCMP409" /LENGTH=140 /DNA_ID=CAMNT_0043504211 /DNA_START=90 /DNA_END=512 /DNA_ORIENTATION=+
MAVGSHLGGLRVDLEQLNVEVQVRIGGDDAASAVCAIAHGTRHVQHGALAEAHLHHALVPALNDLADADDKLKGLVAVPRGVELAPALAQGADVVHGQRVALLGELLAVAGHRHLQREAVAKVHERVLRVGFGTQSEEKA